MKWESPGVGGMYASRIRTYCHFGPRITKKVTFYGLLIIIQTRFKLEIKLVCHPFSLQLRFVASNEIIFKK